ncbi:MAG: peptide MFS transporter [Bacteroides sp.]|jgi:POT family proton-dependent oligopeptide transporter|nr:peptide MFS transporter [Bacteroides sp.]
MSAPKHPKGLYLIFATSTAERFSYYGMRAIFILFLTQALLFDTEKAASIYGSYTGLVYLTPLIGGYIADKYWGIRRSIFWGAIMMAIGQFLMFFSASTLESVQLSHGLMYGGLTLLIMGNGCFKPTVASLVGQLYEPGDKRLDAAYTIFYMGVNVGSFLAPLICGYFGETGDPHDFRWGFLIAAIVTLFIVVLFETQKSKYLIAPNGEQLGIIPDAKKYKSQTNAGEVSEGTSNDALVNKGLVNGNRGNNAKDRSSDGHAKDKRDVNPSNNAKSDKYRKLGIMALLSIALASFFYYCFGNDWISIGIFTACIVFPISILLDSSLTKIERQRIYVIYIIAFFVIFFWAAYEQAGASLTLFAAEQTDRMIFGWEMPASWIQSFNPFFVVTLATIMPGLWRFLDKHHAEPASPAKQAIGLLLLSLGYLFICIGVKDVQPGVKVSLIWLTGLYFIHTIGELSLSPIGLSMVNKLTPVRFASLMMGIWYLSISTANKFAGTLSGLYPENGKVTNLLGYRIESMYDFFMVFVVMSGVASLILFLLSKKLQKMMHGAE